ncbi:MAG TPA: serine/threonine-protein kinase, partial [Trebonia sp.]|nr:serine/threonine-protein kinase [Trebonia sp.]
MAGDASQRGRRLLATLEPGSYVSGYRLESPIGAGGMAAVFRAHDEALDRLVALKLVYAGPGIDQVIRERFVREALSIAKVDHPNIIPVYAAGESDDMLFIAMRYVSGGDLRSLVSRDGCFPPARVAAYISPVAWALDAAHERGLVHRDVKPANVLVDDGRGRRPDHVYLSDFG